MSRIMESVSAEDFLEFHSKSIQSLGIPKWILSDPKSICPTCGAKMSERSIRSITLNLGAKHFGNPEVEFICDKCSTSFILVFDFSFDSISGFANAITKDQESPESYYSHSPDKREMCRLMERYLVKREAKNGPV